MYVFLANKLAQATCTVNPGYTCWQSRLHMLAILAIHAGNPSRTWTAYVQAIQFTRAGIQSTHAGNHGYTCWQFRPHVLANQVTCAGNPGCTNTRAGNTSYKCWQSQLHVLAIQATRVLTICLTLANPVPRQRGGNYSHTLSITNILIYALMVNE